MEYVNEPIFPKELEKIRNSVNRQAPLGEEQWQQETAVRSGQLSTLNERGRPRKKQPVPIFFMFIGNFN